MQNPSTPARWVAFLLISAVPGISVAPAIAQSRPGSSQEHGLDEVVVTAFRRETVIQETPASISAVSGSTLDRQAASNLADFIATVPSLQLVGDFGQRPIIRGVNAIGEPVVGLYYGETPLVGPSGSTGDSGLHAPDLNLFDVERVEVLRGPQGTLYGASSVGGTVRVLFKQPDATKVEGRAEVQATTTRGGDPGWYGKLALNIPLVEDKLAARLVGFRQDRGGYVDNELYGLKNVNGSTSDGGRLILGWTPNDDVTLTVTALNQKTDTDASSAWGQQYGKDDYNSRNVALAPFGDQLDLFNATLKWALGFAELTVTSSYYRWDVDRVIDPNRALGTLLNNLNQPPVSFYQQLGVRSRNNEVRLTSTGDSPLQWTTGVYYENRDDTHNHRIVGQNDSGDQELWRVYGASYAGNQLEQKAAFGELSYRPIDALTLTVGTRRYDYDKTTYGGITRTGFLTPALRPRTEVDSGASGWVSKYNVSYQWTSDLLTYAQASQGFRPGGANNNPLVVADLIEYDPDKLWSYETGVKSSWDEGRLTLNAAVFHIKWDDMQTNLIIPPVTAIVANAGAARIWGFEFETAYRPLDGLTLSANLVVNDGKLTADQGTPLVPLGGAAGRDGNRLPNAPKYTGSVAADYTWPVAGFNGVFRTDATYRSWTGNEFNEASTTYAKIDSSILVNALTGIEDEGWGAYLFVRNLFDAFAPYSATHVVASTRYPAQTVQFTSPPRTIGITLRKDF